MPTVDESIDIDRSPDDVFAFLTTTENIPAFENQISHIEQVTAGDVGVGTQWKGATTVLGRKFDWVVEVDDFDPPNRSHTKSVEGKLPFEIHYTLEPTSGGTRFTYRIDAESGLGGICGKLGDPLVTKAQARSVRTNLANLKELLEAGT
jgi:carbon monoxide dehydrogenase subunit G